jgi:predicted acyltransferase
MIVPAALLLLSLLCYLDDKYGTGAAPPVPAGKPAAPVKERLRSLDVLRGLTLAAMVWANSDASGYEWMDHTPWHGVRFADVIFPFFVMMMGSAIALGTHRPDPAPAPVAVAPAAPAQASVHTHALAATPSNAHAHALAAAHAQTLSTAYLRGGDSSVDARPRPSMLLGTAVSLAAATCPVRVRRCAWCTVWPVLRRGLTLFLLGLFLANPGKFHTFRPLGVLQRFGLVYVAVVLIVQWMPPGMLPAPPPAPPRAPATAAGQGADDGYENEDGRGERGDASALLSWQRTRHRAPLPAPPLTRSLDDAPTALALPLSPRLLFGAALTVAPVAAGNGEGFTASADDLAALMADMPLVGGNGANGLSSGADNVTGADIGGSTRSLLARVRSSDENVLSFDDAGTLLSPKSINELSLAGTATALTVALVPAAGVASGAVLRTRPSTGTAEPVVTVPLARVSRPRAALRVCTRSGIALVAELLAFRWQALSALVLLPALWALLLTLPATDPACPRGYLGPGGLWAEHGRFYPLSAPGPPPLVPADAPSGAALCTGGSARAVDVAVLGERHMFQAPTPQAAYGTPAFDPEGVVGVATTATSAYVGVMLGRVAVFATTHRARVARWLLYSAAFALATWALLGCGSSPSDGPVPVNKNLWTPSFVTLTASLCSLALCACYVLVDATRWLSGKPFLFLGMNSIAVFVGHGLFAGRFPFSWVIDGRPVSHWELACMNAVALAAVVLATYVLYRKKIFISV